jgi:hypothetical protein
MQKLAVYTSINYDMGMMFSNMFDRLKEAFVNKSTPYS